MNNPLLQAFDTPFQTVPFSKIKEEHFIPALEKAIADGKEQIDKIVHNPEAPSFKNTVEAMQYAGELVDRIAPIFFNLNSAETNDNIQKIAQSFAPMLTEYSNDILLNEKLFHRIKVVWESRESAGLDKVEMMLLEKTYKSFVRNGANLNEEGKARLREISKELSKLSLKFGENVLAETNAFELQLTDERDLDGLPQSAKDAARLLAKEKGKEGWLITLDFPSYMPFMKYAKNRDLRKKLSLAYGSRAFKGNEYDNRENVLKIVRLRKERAQLLGYTTHAGFVLEERMAEHPAKVEQFLEELLEKARPAAERQFGELAGFAKATDAIEQLESWDSAYYIEKLKQKNFAFDSEELKPYFQLEKVIEGVFAVAGKLYDIHFEEVFDIDKYHEDVRTFKVLDADDNPVAIFYGDFFPRKGKRGGAWMTSFREQRIKNGVDERPHVSIVCNFTKPTETEPSLLTFGEVTTLFHEFGHALHGMLSQVKYAALSGTNVYWDFVELPSQLFENWCYEKEALDMFARHYKTGAPIPEDLIQKIKDTANFMEGLYTIRQLNFGFLDMAWHHHRNPEQIKKVAEFEYRATRKTSLYPYHPETCASTAFSHIFQGGYSAGYYSYKWAEVLDADAFEFFKERGIFNKEVAGRFKEYILSKGGSEHPAVLYRKFRGKDAEPEALLRRAGLIN
jgi:peptidyl-dipeptidase Dcp